MPIKITPEEYQKKFGTTALQSALQTNKPEEKPGFFGQIGEAFKGGVNQIKQSFTDSKNANGNPIKQIESGLKLGSGIVNTISSPLAPVFKPVGDAINFVGDKVGNIPQVQKFADSKAGQVTSRIAEDTGNLANIAGAIAGFKSAPKVAGAIANTGENVLNKVGEVAKPVKNAVRDVVPTMDQSINHQVTQALDLTASDVKNIHLSTGNEVGRFMADKNLIRENVPASMKAVDDFFQENYKTVRSEIGKVTDTYKPSNVPRYTEALKAIEKKIDKVPGLQETQVEVAQLLGKKKNITLNDVQRVKELIDDHYSIYGKTGDVGEAVAKQGLDNVRKDLKSFIVDQVKEKTGADINELNNNVSTAKGIMKSVEARSTSGLTRSNIQRGDFGAFGVGTALSFPVLGPLAPLAGVAAVFVKKVLEAPSIQLRIAKFLDGISDAKKAQIKATLESGKIPPEFEQFIKKKSGSANIPKSNQ